MSRKLALVTGARRGIGRAVAVELAKRGFDLALVDVECDQDTRHTLTLAAAQGARALFIAADLADLSSHADVIAAARALGPLACLVNSAGIGSPLRGDLLDLAPENFDRVMAINLRGTLFLTLAAARAMLDDPPAEGRGIVTITSVSAALASPERADYCMSKAGLAMFVQTLALRLAPAGIAVFDIRPGIIRTPMTQAVAARYDERIAAGLVPAGRWGEPEDVARAVGAAASGDLAFATGSVIALDGGLSVARL